MSCILVGCIPSPVKTDSVRRIMAAHFIPSQSHVGDTDVEPAVHTSSVGVSSSHNNLEVA